MGFFASNSSKTQLIFTIIFGIFWVINGSLKFQPGSVESVSGIVADAGNGQPSFLSGWFSFWSSAVSANPASFVYGTGMLELILGVCIIFGFLRKTAFIGGLVLSMIIWSVPEGFGGPYGVDSTDIGTGIVYAIAFVFLLLIEAYNPRKLGLDAYLEKKISWWHFLAEVKS